MRNEKNTDEQTDPFSRVHFDRQLIIFTGYLVQKLQSSHLRLYNHLKRMPQNDYLSICVLICRAGIFFLTVSNLWPNIPGRGPQTFCLGHRNQADNDILFHKNIVCLCSQSDCQMPGVRILKCLISKIFPVRTPRHLPSLGHFLPVVLASSCKFDLQPP